MNGAVKKSALGYIAIICLCLLLTGCWDRRELQDRNFVLAAAIDVADAGHRSDQSAAVTRTETFVQPHGEKRYRVSFQLMRFQAAEPEGKKAAAVRTYVISNTGQSIFEMLRDMLGQTSKGLFFEHIQTIVISEAAVKQAGLSPIIDLFRRDAEMRWRIVVYITPGEARPLVEYKPPTGEPGGLFLARIAQLHPRNVHVGGARTDLGYITQMIDNKADVIIPRIELADKVVKVGGLAVFKKDKFVGYIDEYAVTGLKFIHGTEKSAVFSVNCPDHPGEVLVFELFNHDTKLEPHVVGDNIYFTLDIAMRGNIGEIQGTGHDTKNPEHIRKLELLFAEEVKRSVMYAKDVLQALGVDALRFSTKLKAHEPKVWKKIEERWDEIYPTIPMVVSVNVTIRNIGAHK
ncbi:spore germination B3 GerAC family protein [Thermosinus carboxydivorans Nor1]|uniref:Spore germination B3 GerAC family protein n=1 Tax=Thermosinus carboxydivorans Nor1 TaxID=401526 RepID=A1HRT2_9FIRM|nr:Ger(x)C family spore germination protein [Thermosinus carboxydivorans]EAX47253.1 spore germination B3 GerAC family protein [Thermosinus carboxydivorans Nor1]